MESGRASPRDRGSVGNEDEEEEVYDEEDSETIDPDDIFEKIDDNIFVAGCYNGSGIGVGTLFGEQIVIKASNEHSKEIEIIEARKKPTWLPPQPFLNLGVKARLLYERIRAKSEI